MHLHQRFPAVQREQIAGESHIIQPDDHVASDQLSIGAHFPERHAGAFFALVLGRRLEPRLLQIAGDRPVGKLQMCIRDSDDPLRDRHI